MTSRTVNRLHGLEIDEISLVDRPANQHGLVAIAKRAEEAPMALYDADGLEVDPEEIEFGETVTDEAGNQFYMASPEEAAQLGYGEAADMVSDDDGGTTYDFDDEYDDELVGVGKAGSELTRAARFTAGRGGTRVAGSMGPGRGTRARAGARNAAAGARRRGGDALGAADTFGRSAARNRGVRIGAGAAGAGAVGYGAGRVKKSLGDSVLEELSKALDSGSRNDVIAKMADIVDDARAEAAEATYIAKSLLEQQELSEYVDIAKSYDLPVDEVELGGILMQVSKTLNPQQLNTLDRVLSTAGASMTELGYNGYVESDVMSQVQALATDAVSKNNDFSVYQATTALFEANPDAYDEYLAESR